MPLQFEELYYKIIQAFRNKEIDIKKSSLKLVNSYIKSSNFKLCLQEIINKGDYSSFAVFNLCLPLLNKISGKEIDKDFLLYVYEYILSKSFPQAADFDQAQSLNEPCRVYIIFLREISEFQKHNDKNSWQGVYPLEFISDDEAKEYEGYEEYKKFTDAFLSENVYEMMKLNQELLNFNTLDHICGVNYVSMYIARNLKKLKIPVDITRVSGAAIGHDIGKYGCRQNEKDKVPYLHYYYTDLWFKKHGINYIKNIAINHSTWDLELENLSIESLILIYSDFRVKNVKDELGNISMEILSLNESFDVILNKLDNVDDEKYRRYKKVFLRLKNFEDYIKYLGIDTDFNETIKEENKVRRNYSLMNDKDIVNAYKYLSIDYNIRLMYKLRNEASLTLLLHNASGEKNAENLRLYLYVIDEYSTYLTQNQKITVLKYLYDNLTNSDEDIRNICAEIMGKIIALFDEDYRKSVPENEKIDMPEFLSVDLLRDYINLMLHPDIKIIPLHVEWIGKCLKYFIKSLFSHAYSNQANDFAKVILEYYSFNDKNDEINIYIVDALNMMPIESFSQDKSIREFLTCCINSSNEIIRLHALLSIEKIILSDEDKKVNLNYVIQNIKLIYKNPLSTAEKYTIIKIFGILNIKDEYIDKLNKELEENKSLLSGLYLSNLKSATDSLTKIINIDLIFDFTMKGKKEDAFYSAMHFCNILKVSASEAVRNHAGEVLLKLIPYLSSEEINDIVVELLRALEIEGYQFTKYIPNYVGRVILNLKYYEISEVIDDFIDKTKKSDSKLCTLLIKTIGVAISNYKKVLGDFKEGEKVNDHVRRMLGILLNSLSNYSNKIRRSAFITIGSDIFNSKDISLEDKKFIFSIIGKKLLTLLSFDDDILSFFTNASGLNYIYKFISEYNLEYGEICAKRPSYAAFFPGTFDPFSLSHREIVREITKMDFDVYLAVDEFSWSKQTLPNNFRKNIINMSISDEFNVYLYPQDIPVNIASDRDLLKLKESFYGYKDVFIVAGSDVIVNASAYKNDSSLILSYSHIIFERRTSLNYDESKLKLTISKIKGEIIQLNLKPQYEDISSSQIRECIDNNKDTSKLLDPLAQKYIYEYSLYRREPQYKMVYEPFNLNCNIYEPSSGILDVIFNNFKVSIGDLGKCLSSFAKKENPRIAVLRDTSAERIVGFSMFHWVRSGEIFEEVKDLNISQFIRENSKGRIIFIDAVYAVDDYSLEKYELERIVLTEMLSFCIHKDYDYAVFKNTLNIKDLSSVYKLLHLSGFNRIKKIDGDIYYVDMSSPTVLILDILSYIKEPLRSNNEVYKTILSCRDKLEESLCALYPNDLKISFNRDMLHLNLIKKICEENGVSYIPQKNKVYGEAMCVPFGSILRRYLVPNTVTKTLHNEKIFSPDMKSFKIEALPSYLSLENQVKTLSSFNRPVILVDDILNKGYRMKVINPLIKKYNIEVKKIITGITSGRGKEIMDVQGRKVDFVYYIPNLKVWFNESLMYPFIGGDALLRDKSKTTSIIPSINLILPYTFPKFLRGAAKESIFNLSYTCIQNSIEILTVIEQEYERTFGRVLTISELGEVFYYPRYIEHGSDMNYDLNLSPSHYLKNDLELLLRMEEVIK